MTDQELELEEWRELGQSLMDAMALDDYAALWNLREDARILLGVEQ